MKEIWSVLTSLNVWAVAFRIFLAVLVGGCIGLERGRHGRAAGLRTHILVCLGSSLTTLLGLYIHYNLGFNNDPLRMGAQVISGIGFLGVGTIIVRKGSQVTGLTTAAGLWTTASIGLTIGAGFYWAALVAFLMILITNSVLVRIEHTSRRNERKTYYIELSDIREAKSLYCKWRDHLADVKIIPARSGLPQHVGMEIVTQAEDVWLRLQEEEAIIIALPVRV